MNSAGGRRHLRFVEDDSNFAHDAATFERYYRESYRKVYGYVYSLVLNREDTEDVVSDAFMKAAKAFGRFDPSKASFATWVCTIARNLVYSLTRKRQSHNEWSETDLDVDFNRFASPEEEPKMEDDSKEAARLLAVLNDSERELVYLKFYSELSNKEIAERLNLNASTVGTKLSRAVAKMRKVAEA